MASPADLRCIDCRQIGCECPKGYFAGILHCEVCGFRFVLSAAECVRYVVRCPDCGGSVDEER